MNGCQQEAASTARCDLYGGRWRVVCNEEKEGSECTVGLDVSGYDRNCRATTHGQEAKDVQNGTSGFDAGGVEALLRRMSI